VRALLQRVSQARVRVDGEIVGAIESGLLILLGVRRGDADADARRLAEKCAHLRAFAGPGGHVDRSLLEVGGAALVVSQFTLYGDCRKGRRPSFTEAAPPEAAEALYDAFCAHLHSAGVPVARGEFRAAMSVELINEGPVTLLVESA
jgi:D-tyrosyl-tRNA(Tyr) deacylase